MVYTILVIFLVILSIWIYRKVSSKKEDDIAKPSAANNNSKSEPRDFLKDADGWLNTPKPLKEMLSESRSYVIDKIIELLNYGGIYERKYAAFALGQIGEKRFLQCLENRLTQETVKGVQEAIGSAKVGILRASLDEGFSEMDRRKIITAAYNRYL